MSTKDQINGKRGQGHRRSDEMHDSSDQYDQQHPRRRRYDEDDERDHSSSRFGPAPINYRHERPTSNASRGVRRSEKPEEDDLLPPRGARRSEKQEEDELPPAMFRSLERLFKTQREDIAKDFDARFREAEERMERAEAKSDALEQRLLALENARASSAFEHAEHFPSRSPASQPAPKLGFDREADPCILTCNIENKSQVALKEMESLIASLIDEKGWEPSIADVIGKDVGSFFRIKFGSKANGPEQASAIADLLYNKTTKQWRELKIQNVDGTPVRAFVGKDVAPRTARLAGASKRLARDIVKILGDNHKSWYRPYDGKIAVDAVPTARVSYAKDGGGKDTEDLVVSWLPQPLSDLGLLEHKQKLTDEFLARENQKWISECVLHIQISVSSLAGENQCLLMECSCVPTS